MPELSPTGYEVLQAAVRSARDNQILTLKALRDHLGRLFPARDDDIEQAITYWAAHVRLNGVGT